MYKVLVHFVDLQDGNHSYQVGDTFPHDGLMVSEERLLELSTDANRRHKALIERVEEGFMNPPEDDTELSEEKAETPKPRKKRGRPRNDA